MIPQEDGIYSDIPEREYHADRESLSSSGARKLKVPAQFRWEQDNPSPPTTAMDFGTAVHTFVLGAGPEIVSVDAKSRSAKAYLEANTDRGDTVPLLAAEVLRAKAAAEALKSHPIVAKHLTEGRAELSGYYRHNGVRLRFRPDWLNDTVCLDVKTAQSADPDEFSRSVAKWGYHQQQAWYEDGLAAHGITGLRFLFAVVEKEPPYLASVCELDPESVNEGRRLNRQAIDTYLACTESGMWPGYGTTVHPINLPAWAFRARNQAIYEEAAELERNWDDIFSPSNQ